MREIVFDTETTGISPVEGHRVVEIGCVEIVNRVPTGRTYHVYCNPGRPMPRDAENVHGLGDAFLADKPYFPAIAKDFLAFIGDAKLVAHNAGFDMAFLDNELRACGYPPLGADRAHCTLQIARRRFPGASHTLDALCKRFGVDRSARVKHGALVDAQLLVEIYVELNGGRQIGLGLTSEARGSHAAVVQAPRAARNPRPHAASEAELSAHAAFVNRLVDPVWHRP